MKSKAIAAALLAACALIPCFGCAKKPAVKLPVPAQQSVEYRNDADELLATCTLRSVKLQPGDEGKQDQVQAVLLFENKSDVALMRIACDADFVDASGNVLLDAGCQCDYHKDPLPPGETREYNVFRWIYDGENVAGVALAITAVVTIEEEAPLPKPKTGETLFDFYQRADIAAFADGFHDNPPEKAVVFMDSWNQTEATLTDPEEIAAVFDAMRQIRVEKKIDQFYTDNYNDVTFVQADGTKFYFMFNRYNLEYDGEWYALSGDEPLWELLHALLGA